MDSIISMASSWSNQQQEETDQESLVISNGAKMDPTEDIFYPIQVLQKAQISQLNSYPERSGLITSWQDTTGREMGSFSSSSHVTAPQPLGNLVAADEFGMADQSLVVNNNNNIGLQGVKPAAGISTTCSFESLECFLSATNSSADTSVEDDDGISILFSDSSNLWSFGANNNSAVSSRESESNAPNIGGNKDLILNNYAINNGLDEEKVSCSSLDQYNVNNGGRPLKRKIDHQSEQFHILRGTDSRIQTEGGFKLISESPLRTNKKPRFGNQPSSSNINFQQASNNNNSSVSSCIEEPDPEAIAHMKEMIYRAAAFRPVNLGLEVVEKPKRKNVRISTDPQTVAARQRRERISERIRVLQRLVPGGSKMDTASMLDEAANYLKFLRSQVKALETLSHQPDTNLAFSSLPFNNNSSFSMQTHLSIQNPNLIHLPKS